MKTNTVKNSYIQPHLFQIQIQQADNQTDLLKLQKPSGKMLQVIVVNFKTLTPLPVWPFVPLASVTLIQQIFSPAFLKKSNMFLMFIVCELKVKQRLIC